MITRAEALAEIERLKALEIANGDRDKWEATQPGAKLERILAEESARRLRLTLDDLRKVDQMERISDEELRDWAEKRADDAGRLARELIKAIDVGALLEALREIAKQKLAAEIEQDDVNNCDWQTGHEEVVGIARTALAAYHAKLKETRE